MVLSRPTAERILPQFASLPNIAVLTRGDSATVKATDLACWRLLALLTEILIFFVAPSASSIKSSASSLKIPLTHCAIFFSALELVSTNLASFPFATSAEESFGEVSPSTVIALKLQSNASACILFSDLRFIFASINTKLSKVAKSGLIIPEPFAKPVIENVCFPIVIFFEIILGLVSVVSMAFAAFAQFFGDNFVFAS